MNFNVAKSAKDLFQGHPEAWLSLIDTVVEAVLPDREALSADQRSFWDQFLPVMVDELSSPDFARGLSECSSEEVAVKILVGRVLDSINNERQDLFSQFARVDHETFEAWWLPEDTTIFDIYGNDWAEDPPLAYWETAREEFLESMEIGEIESRVAFRLSSGPELRPKQGHLSALQLSPIDLSLYRALQEHPDFLKNINWRTFERLLADILESLGYKIDLMQGTKDGGIDIIAFRSETEGFGEQRYIIQAKRWANKVGVEPVRQLLFLHGHHRATKACLATTSTFTSGAWELARQYRWQLSLRDLDGIQAWIARAAHLKYGR